MSEIKEVDLSLEQKNSDECNSEEISKETLKEIMIYEAQFAEKILDREMKRQEDILQQASHMQTAFSFATATIFMALPVIVGYKGSLSYEFLLFAFSTITILLFVSLFLATFAQRRIKEKEYPSISSFIKYIEDNYTKFLKREQREKYLADTYADIQKSYEDSNKKRSNCLFASTMVFYASLVSAFVFFVIGIINLYF